MKTVEEHYASHLAPIYEWMIGGMEAAFAEGESELEALGLPASKVDAVLDLGAGPGAHAIPLARRGAQVTAVDTSEILLGSLRAASENLPLQTVTSDLMRFLQYDAKRYAAILCMGDTLTHLRNWDEVAALLDSAYRALLPGGRLVLGFRDYTTELRGEQRFIPVRADDRRIMTCFLEFEESAVRVHDMLHERSAQGWQTRVSVYRKLRLEPERVQRALHDLGFTVRREMGFRGMIRLIASKE